MEQISSPVLLAATFSCTLIGTLAYRSLAVHAGIVANPNSRSLHQLPIPRGGGIVFAGVFIAAVLAISRMTTVDPNLTNALVFGGIVAATFGFADDVAQLPAWLKFSMQGILAASILGSFNGHTLVDLPYTPVTVDLVLSWLGLVWLMNVYNFIDGIDGLAASGAVMISMTSVVVLLITSANHGLLLTFGVLAVCNIGFLVLNWPPATIFMGDAGSLFLGFCFSALMASTITGGQIELWVWLAMLGYFAGDTTTTTLLRILIVEKWYGEHRSHAYQNLARLSGSHQRVLRGVSLYHLFWLLPLAVGAAQFPKMAPLAAVLAIAPAVVLTVRYGPTLSSS